MTTQLIKLETPELQGIEKSKAQKIKETFEPMVIMLNGFEEKYEALIKESEKEITAGVCANAKRLRIDIGRVRIETGKLKDQEKAEYLRAGKAIQGVHNILVWAVTDKENKLKEIENHFEIIERKRLNDLQIERVKLLSNFVDDAAERNLSIMDQDVWDAYFSTKKREYNDRIEAEKKAEADRIAREKAEAKERERIRLENLRLKEEADEREKADKIRIAKEESERKKREEIQRKEKAAYEVKLKAEQQAKQKIINELKAKEESERVAELNRIEKIQSELAKNDKDKFKDLLKDLEDIKSKYQFRSEKFQKKNNEISLLIDKIINHVK